MEKLTPRQKQIAKLLVAGYSQKTIAHQLGISRHTIYGHTRDMRERTGKTTVGIAVRVAQAGETGR